MTIHRIGLGVLGLVAGLFLYDSQTRRLGWIVLGAALGLATVEAFGADTCDQVRGYINVTDTSTSESGATHRADGDFMEVNRLDMGVGYDEMRAAVVTDPQSWKLGCDGIDLTLDYSVALYSGFSIPIAWVSAGPFETDCVGSWPCQKDGTIQLTVRPGQQLDLGAGISGGATGHATWIFSGPFHVVPPRFSLDTKQKAQKVADGLDAYTIAAGGGAGMAKLLKRLPIARVLAASATATSAISALIKQVLKFDPWDGITTVFRPRPFPMPAGIPTKYQPWIRNELEMRRWWLGVYVALNRANTAVATKDAVNEDRQQGAIDSYMAKIHVLVGREVAFRKKYDPDFAPFNVDLDEPGLMAALKDFD